MTADTEARPTDSIKFSACVCTNFAHESPDRYGWVREQSDAHADLLRAGLTGRSAHIIRRETTVTR